MCSSKQAYEYFAGITREDGSYSCFSDWVPKVCHIPDKDDLFDYDIAPITLGIIKGVL